LDNKNDKAINGCPFFIMTGSAPNSRGLGLMDNTWTTLASAYSSAECTMDMCSVAFLLVLVTGYSIKISL